MNTPATCTVCPRHCRLVPGQLGFCRARINSGGEVKAQNYGRLTALALDPIEKKPLRHFHPGSSILSLGSYGCNLQCPFCQNHEIAHSHSEPPWQTATAEALCQKALLLKSQGNIGFAFTYNEPAVGYEWVRMLSRMAAGQGLYSVMVTNGYFSPAILQALLPSVAAFNIDLKCFTEEGYRKLGGKLSTVQNTIRAASNSAHLEVTTLVVPGFSDSAAEMEAEAAWLAEINPDLPLHLTRYFPRYHMQKPPTPPATLQALAAVAKRHLRHVYLGNV